MIRHGEKDPAPSPPVAGLPLTLVALAATACGLGEAPMNDDGVWGETRLVEELRIGDGTGADEYLFGRIRNVAVGLDGTIFVHDRQVGLRRYDEEGTFLGDVGRQGQGPGEYTDLRGLEVLPDGRLVSIDLGNNRVSLWSPDGEYLGSFDTATVGFHPAPANILMNGYSYGSTRNLEVDLGGAIYLPSVDDMIAFAKDEGQAVYLRFAPDGEPLGHLLVPRPQGTNEPGFMVSDPAVSPRNFPTETLYAWNPLGFPLIGRNDVYDIELVNPAGTSHFTRDIEPAHLRSEEHAEWAALTAYENQRAQDQSRDIRHAMPPATKPYFRHILSGKNGRVWVLRYTEAEKVDLPPVASRNERPVLTYREPPTFDVFEPNATFLGTVVVPQTTRLLVARDDLIWGVDTDEAGVERIVRFRIEHDGN